MTFPRRQVLIGTLGGTVACLTGLGAAGAAPASAPATSDAKLPMPVGAALNTSAALDRAAVSARAPAQSVLLGVAQAGTRLVAVGERGIVIVSDDAGKTWRQVVVPVSITLTAVRFADARTGYVVGHGGTVLTTADGGLTWVRRLDGRRIAEIEIEAAQSLGDRARQSAERLKADGPDKPLLDVQVFDARRALVIGAYGLALATEDGGVTWSSWRTRLDNPKELHLYAVRRHGDHLVVAGEQGLVQQSLDGGRSFRRLAVPYAGSFFTLEMPAPQDIVLAGLRGQVWRSTDGGVQWRKLASPVPASITASAQDGAQGLLFVNQAGMMLRAVGDALAPLPGPGLPPLTAVLPTSEGRLVALSLQGFHALNPTPPSRQP